VAIFGYRCGVTMKRASGYCQHSGNDTQNCWIKAKAAMGRLHFDVLSAAFIRLKASLPCDDAIAL
jgi:hypothetical protein